MYHVKTSEEITLFLWGKHEALAISIITSDVCKILFLQMYCISAFELHYHVQNSCVAKTGMYSTMNIYFQ
uniref:Uncharacterized protein n=1 Tax=Anguilla anguilla TaxID=7936 RepID=A0A0E9XBK7_ANGAN